MDAKNAKEAQDENEIGIRKGPWTLEEDTILVNYITAHGEGHWNTVARSAGVRRSGKSCRLRWLNYLRPDVRRGNITLQEQILILDLHSRWGNRWSKIAQQLPGRTDNEIKNYWRTRVIKQAKQLNCDVNSKQFRDTLRYVWLPHLIERVQPASKSLDGNEVLLSQNGLHSSVSGAELVKPNHNSSCNSGTTSSDSLSVDFLVNPSNSGHIHDGLGDKGSELWPSFDNDLEQGNGGGDGDSSLENFWNDHASTSMWSLHHDMMTWK